MAQDSSQDAKRHKSTPNAPPSVAPPATRLQTGRFVHLRSLIEEQELLREQRRLLEQRLQLLHRMGRLKEQRAELGD